MHRFFKPLYSHLLQKSSNLCRLLKYSALHEVFTRRAKMMRSSNLSGPCHIGETGLKCKGLPKTLPQTSLQRADQSEGGLWTRSIKKGAAKKTFFLNTYLLTEISVLLILIVISCTRFILPYPLLT